MPTFVSLVSAVLVLSSCQTDRQTDRHTESQTDNAKRFTPATVAGVSICMLNKRVTEPRRNAATVAVKLLRRRWSSLDAGVTTPHGGVSSRATAGRRPRDEVSKLGGQVLP